MWYAVRRDRPDWAEALRHLSGADPVMRGLIARSGPCTLSPRRDHLVILLQSILSQQVSYASAEAIFKRLKALLPGRRPTPVAVLALDEAALRSAGLSRQKASYVRDLALHFADGRIPTRRLARMDDEAVIDALVKVHGVGRWTAEMFLIFTLARPDVLPVDDLGIRKAFAREYGLRALPDADKMRTIAEPWRPWRTIGTWYLWKGGDGT